jgi:ABC-2 type transport system permease protein
MNGFVDKLWAVMRRDLLMMLRYRGGFWMELAGIVVEVSSFYFLARAIGPEYRPEGIPYFPYVLIGTSFYAFLMAGMSTFVHTVREAQVTGTMEVMMTTSTPGPAIVLLTAMSAFTGRAFQLMLALVLGFTAFGFSLHSPNVLAAVAIFVLSLVVVMAIGMLAAAVQVAIQRGASVLWLLASLTALMTGTMFPVSVLPKPLLAVARAIPITYSIDGLRGALLRGASFQQLLTPFSVLAAYAAALLPFSLWLLSQSLRLARQRGTLSFY